MREVAYCGNGYRGVVAKTEAADAEMVTVDLPASTFQTPGWIGLKRSGTVKSPKRAEIRRPRLGMRRRLTRLSGVEPIENGPG
jgi:hypothetical protein